MKSLVASMNTKPRESPQPNHRNHHTVPPLFFIYLITLTREHTRMYKNWTTPRRRFLSIRDGAPLCVRRSLVVISSPLSLHTSLFPSNLSLCVYVVFVYVLTILFYAYTYDCTLVVYVCVCARLYYTRWSMMMSTYRVFKHYSFGLHAFDFDV